MKKEILFVLPTFEIGGTVVSTINLIVLLDKGKYNVTILSMTGRGIMKYLYENVRQISTTFMLASLSYNSWMEPSSCIRRFLCAFIRIISKISQIRKQILKTQAQRIIKSDYDIVVACEEGLCSEFVS